MKSYDLESAAQPYMVNGMGRSASILQIQQVQLTFALIASERGRASLSVLYYCIIRCVRVCLCIFLAACPGGRGLTFPLASAYRTAVIELSRP